MSKRKKRKTTTAKTSTTARTTGNERGAFASVERPTTRLGYDALSERGMARPLVVSARTEDKELSRRDRLALSSSARELARNFALFGFALRQHLCFVSNFRFACASGDRTLDEAVEREFGAWARDPERCHFSKRHDFWTLLRLIETHRVRDGDVGALRVDDGETQAIQLIEGDRIRDEDAPSATQELKHGVRVGRRGENLAYKIYRRTPEENGYAFERWISARKMDLIGYFDAHDQVRGVSPLPSGVREYWHLYECFDLALIKMKSEMTIGLIVNRDKSDDGFGTDAERAARAENAFDPRAASEKYGDGLMLFDLGLNEKASVFHDGTPSQNFQSFVESTTRLALAALDVPYSFYDGSSTNFYGSRGELNHYVERCKLKQRAFFPFLNKTTRWLLECWERDGRIPRGAASVPFRWTGAAVPLWLLVGDAKDWQVAISNGFADQRTACELHGVDPRGTLRRTSETLDDARANGVSLAYAPEYAGKTNIGI